MNKKTFTIYGVILIGISVACNLGIFVKFSDMQAYAVSKDQFDLIRDDLKEIKANQNFLTDKIMEMQKELK